MCVWFTYYDLPLFLLQQAVQYLTGAKFSEEIIAKIGVPLTKMMKEIISINRELNKVQDLDVPSSTGKLNSFVTEHV